MESLYSTRGRPNVPNRRYGILEQAIQPVCSQPHTSQEVVSGIIRGSRLSVKSIFTSLSLPRVDIRALGAERSVALLAASTVRLDLNDGFQFEQQISLHQGLDVILFSHCPVIPC